MDNPANLQKVMLTLIQKCYMEKCFFHRYNVTIFCFLYSDHNNVFDLKHYCYVTVPKFYKHIEYVKWSKKSNGSTNQAITMFTCEIFRVHIKNISLNFLPPSLSMCYKEKEYFFTIIFQDIFSSFELHFWQWKTKFTGRTCTNTTCTLTLSSRS